MRDRVIEIYQGLVAEYDDLKIKGKKSAYTATNGNMFSFVDPEGLFCIRLSRDDKAAFEAEHGTGDVIQYGAVMRGYVPVPVEMLEDAPAMASLFANSVINARALKPKPTTKKK